MMEWTRNLVLSVLAATITAGTASAAEPSHLTARMHGMRNNDGQVMCALFKGAKGFPEGEAAVQGAVVKPADAKATCHFKNLQSGTYAVGVIHDEDGDGEMDTVLAIPTEGFGFSNNAKPGMFGPPDFKDAAFRVSGGKRALSIKMRYL